MNLGINNNYQCNTSFGCCARANACKKTFSSVKTTVPNKPYESNVQILKHVLNGIWTNAKIDANNLKNFIKGKIS